MSFDPPSAIPLDPLNMHVRAIRDDVRILHNKFMAMENLIQEIGHVNQMNRDLIKLNNALKKKLIKMELKVCQ